MASPHKGVHPHTAATASVPVTARMPLRTLGIIAFQFVLSTVLTAFFIRAYRGYISPEIMVLSGSIAGGKWAIQLVLGWCLLGDKRWAYISQLATVCLLGSVVLVPFAIFSGGAPSFFGSLIACIIVMGLNILRRLPRIGLSWRWPALWFALLAIAVTLQLTVVFHVIG